MDRCVQHNIPRFDGYVRSGAYRDADVGHHEGRCIVYPVANHRDALACLLHLFDLSRFVFREHLRHHAIDTELRGNGPCHWPCVSREHRHFDALRVETSNRFTRFGPDNIRYNEHAKNAALLTEVQRGTARGRRSVSDRSQGRGRREPKMLQQRRSGGSRPSARAVTPLPAIP